MKVLEKLWGTQVWISEYELLMVMKAGGKTSTHKHSKHITDLKCLSGSATLETYTDDRPYQAMATTITGTRNRVWSGQLHRIVADTDCVIYEKYRNAACSPIPEEDIERLPEC